MKMSPREIFALRDYLGPDLTGRTISDARRIVSLTDIRQHTCLSGRLGELSARSVLMAVSDQLISGLVMIEIDGVARRMLLCPPDLNADHLQSLMQDAEIDAVITDQPERWASSDVKLIVPAGPPAGTAAPTRTERATEWLMLTSPGEALADHIARLQARGVTNISGTPSHWRKLLMSGATSGFTPRYVRLSGE